MKLASAFAVALLVAAEPTPYEAGAEAFGAGRYDEAAEYFERAYDGGNVPDVLYDWAQAERKGGHCDEAEALYARFLRETTETTADPAVVPQARWTAMRQYAGAAPHDCEPAPEPAEPVAGEGDDDDSAGEEPQDAAAEESPPPEPEPEHEPAPEPEPEPSTLPDEPTRRPWRRDPTGIALVSVGSAVAAAGAGLLVAAEVQRRSARDSFLHQDQRDGLARAGDEQLAGFVVLPVGAALAIGGIIRFAVVAKKERRLAVTPTARGVVISARF